jgi:large subunit ribosomal protein L30
MQEAVRTFFVTLRRSPIGVPWFHKRVLRSLGLVRRHDCVERPNNANVRGQLEKVAHLVRIETDAMFYSRKLNEAAAAELRPPIVVQHGGGSSSSGVNSGPQGLGQR